QHTAWRSHELKHYPSEHSERRSEDHLLHAILQRFQLAVSYVPDGTQDRSAFGTGGTNEEGQVSNVWSIGADYSGEFGGFTIGAGGGYTKGYGETGES